jgi:hypothetical protein
MTPRPGLGVGDLPDCASRRLCTAEALGLPGSSDEFLAILSGESGGGGVAQRRLVEEQLGGSLGRCQRGILQPLLVLAGLQEERVWGAAVVDSVALWATTSAAPFHQAVDVQWAVRKRLQRKRRWPSAFRRPSPLKAYPSSTSDFPMMDMLAWRRPSNIHFQLTFRYFHSI